ncbi:MAG: helix-turn-helix domain-containing protein [Oscillospiraceae bacterium]|nr:helix-turn-helix domain-containing protein [Oscillospiraceae bacterium]
MVEANKIKDLSLGKKIRQIRIDRKITQQELVGDFITRNMLSQIENDIATPSIKTLQYIADHLEVPLSFLMVGEHDDEFNRNYEYDDDETIRAKARRLFFAGDYLKYIEIAEDNPQILDGSKEAAMFLSLACVEAASESFLSGNPDKCLEYCGKIRNCVYIMGELPVAGQLKRAADLYGFLCQPIITESGEEYITSKTSGINSNNFISMTFDGNGWCRYNITEAHRALKGGRPRESLEYLREADIFIKNYEKHPYRKELYKLFERAYLETEDYKNAHLYSSKILALYSGK